MDGTFQTFHRILSLAGISIYAKSNWNSKLWLLLQIFNFLMGLFALLFITAYLLFNYTDRLLYLEAASMCLNSGIMFISLCVCLGYQRTFRKFLTKIVFKDSIRELPLVEYILTTEYKGKMNELKEMVIKTQEELIKFMRIMLKTYFCAVCLCQTLYLGGPIYKILFGKDDSLRPLPFCMWIPWSLEKLSVYILTFIFNSYVGHLCCIVYPGLHTTIILLTCQIIRQLRILTFILHHLDELVVELVGERSEKWQVYCTKVLSQCVKHYVWLRRFSNNFNVICRPLYLILILGTTVILCLCSVEIATSNKFSPYIFKYYVEVFSCILVIFLFCSLGQQVENECEKLEISVTKNWYIYNKEHKMDVLIFATAVSQRMPIYIFGSVTLSLPTFTWFIKSAMSFFTLVMSVLEE